MAILADNDAHWIEIEIGARALAKKLDLAYVPFPLGSKKPWQEPKPSAPTEKHLYMLLPHAIGMYPPAQYFDVVVVATMSPTAFFESMLEKYEHEVTKYPSDDDSTVLLDLTSANSIVGNPERPVIFKVHYCRLPHKYSDRISAPETIPLNDALPNRDLLARLYDARYMVKKVRGLDDSAVYAQPVAPGSVGFRACVSQLLKWAVSCGILSPRLFMLTTEMIVFCVNEAWQELDVRGVQDRFSRETIGRLIEQCMYPKVLGTSVRKGQLAIRTPSGRNIGCSAAGSEFSLVATETIKRAITRDMTSVPNIALRVAEGRRRFQGEHDMYLQIVVRCWKPKAMSTLKPAIYPILTHLADEVMLGPMRGAVETRIWPLFCETADVPREEGWVNYIGISETIAHKRMDFQKYCRYYISEERLDQLQDECMRRTNFDQQGAFIDISMHYQAELFGDVEPGYGLDVNDSVDFEAILGPEQMATIRAKPEDPADELVVPAGLGNEAGGATDGQQLPQMSRMDLDETSMTTSRKAADGPTPEKSAKGYCRNDSAGKLASGIETGFNQAGPSWAPQRFRTAAQAMHRLKWDAQHAALDYEVGYNDRFAGTMWKPLDEWQVHTEEEDFIPEHRVVLLRQLHWPQRVVWDRQLRYDGTGGIE